MDGSMFIGTWWSLVPPLLAIVLAFLTKEVYNLSSTVSKPVLYLKSWPTRVASLKVILLRWAFDDASAVLLARDISKKIEAEMEYPGQIKVVIIRETRAVDYAK